MVHAVMTGRNFQKTFQLEVTVKFNLLVMIDLKMDKAPLLNVLTPSVKKSVIQGGLHKFNRLQGRKKISKNQ